MDWDKHRAVEYARMHAGSSSQRKCAHFVSNAIRAGGARLINTYFAKDMGQIYTPQVSGQYRAHHRRGMSQLSNPPTDARRVMPVYMTVTAPGIQISNNELCTR